MPDTPAQHRPVVCPRCGSDVTGFAGFECPVCKAESSPAIAQRIRRGLPVRRGFWKDGRTHFVVPLAMALLAPIAAFLISIPFASERRPPLAFPCPGIAVMLLLGAASVYAAGLGTRHHRLTRVGAAFLAWLAGLVPALVFVYLTLKAAAGWQS